jgi:hypothetical protein
MTKCIVLGETPKDVKKKPIQLIYAVERVHENDRMYSEKPILDISIWDNIELVCRKGAYYSLDIMFAYQDGDRNSGCLYLGHWNDGVVE